MDDQIAVVVELLMDGKLGWKLMQIWNLEEGGQYLQWKPLKELML